MDRMIMTAIFVARVFVVHAHLRMGADDLRAFSVHEALENQGDSTEDLSAKMALTLGTVLENASKTAAPRKTVPQPALKSSTSIRSGMQKFEEEIKGLFANMKSLAAEDCIFDEKGISYAKCWALDNAQAKVTIITLAAGIPDLYLKGMRFNRLNYIQKHATTKYCEYSHPLSTEKPAQYSKFLAISALSEKEAEGHAFVWMDADALIMNMALTFPTSKKDVVYTTDLDAPRGTASASSSINTGVFVVHNSDWSRHFFSDLWSDFPKSLEYCRRRQWCDQRAVLMYRDERRTEFDSHVEIIPWDRMNSIANTYQEGDFVLHLAGGGGDRNSIDKYYQLHSKYMSGNSACCSEPQCGGTYRSRASVSAAEPRDNTGDGKARKK